MAKPTYFRRSFCSSTFSSHRTHSPFNILGKFENNSCQYLLETLNINMFWLIFYNKDKQIRWFDYEYFLEEGGCRTALFILINSRQTKSMVKAIIQVKMKRISGSFVWNWYPLKVISQAKIQLDVISVSVQFTCDTLKGRPGFIDGFIALRRSFDFETICSVLWSVNLLICFTNKHKHWLKLKNLRFCTVFNDFLKFSFKI